MRAYPCDITLSGVTGPGVVVEFEKPWRLVFWSKAQYVPCWDLGRGVWFTPEWLETNSPDDNHCYEPIMDKKCRYSSVKILESGEARCRVLWHYALCDSRYRIFHGNTTADEYYTVYPDGIAIRRLVAWPGNGSDFGGNPNMWEVMEFILVNGDGSVPEQNLEKEVFTLQSETGEAIHLQKEFTQALCLRYPQLADWNVYIGRVHVSDRPDPFVIFAKDRRLFPFVTCPHCKKDHPHFTCFGLRDGKYPAWPHWPMYSDEDFVGGLPRGTEGTEKLATHTSFVSCQYSWAFNGAVPCVSPERPTTWLFLTGATEQPSSYLRELAKSWLNPAKITVLGSKRLVLYEGYSYSDRAYVFRKFGEDDIHFDMKPAVKVINPVFIVNRWTGSKANVSLNGESPSKDEYRSQVTGEDLIVWLNRELTEPAEVRIHL